MANSDYSVVGSGQFCPVARLMTGLSPGTTMIGVSDVRSVEPGDVAVGSLILIGEEIMQIASLGSPTWTIKRGCLDTIPMGHGAGQTIFVIDRLVGSNFVEYLGTQTISVKLQAKAVGGVVPMEYTPPHQVTFNQRFARPYPPGQMLANGQPWYALTEVDAVTGLVLSWAGRNKVLQADQVLGQHDGSVTVDPALTYTVRVYTESDVLVRTIDGLTGSGWTYQFDQVVTDFGLWSQANTGIYRGYLTIHATQGGLDSLHGYRVVFDLDTADIVATPRAPTGLTLGTATATTQPLSWTAPASVGGAPITDYIVQFSANGTTWTTFADGASTSTTATVTGLSAATNYSHRVAAANSFGTGVFSTIASGSTA